MVSLILTILNTFAIIYIFTHKLFSFSGNRVFGSELVGYCFYYKGNQFFYLPIKNERKTQIKYDVNRMIEGTEQSKRQILDAMFSWLKTKDEVEQFRKDYCVVDSVLVNKMVDDFKEKIVKEVNVDMSDYCDCDGRDMSIYEEDGKSWCPQCGLEVYLY